MIILLKLVSYDIKKIDSFLLFLFKKKFILRCFIFKKVNIIYNYQNKIIKDECIFLYFFLKNKKKKFFIKFFIKQFNISNHFYFF